MEERMGERIAINKNENEIEKEASEEREILTPSQLIFSGTMAL